MGRTGDPDAARGPLDGASARGSTPVRAPGADQGGYRHVRYDDLVTFDFLLPLTREDRLRRALDDEPGRPDRGAEVRAEVRLIEVLFLELFAEAVVHAVEGEDEIWLVESGPTRRLYVWERA